MKEVPCPWGRKEAFGEECWLTTRWQPSTRATFTPPHRRNMVIFRSVFGKPIISWIKQPSFSRENNWVRCYFEDGGHDGLDAGRSAHPIHTQFEQKCLVSIVLFPCGWHSLIGKDWFCSVVNPRLAISWAAVQNHSPLLKKGLGHRADSMKDGRQYSMSFAFFHCCI